MDRWRARLEWRDPVEYKIANLDMLQYLVFIGATK